MESFQPCGDPPRPTRKMRKMLIAVTLWFPANRREEEFESQPTRMFHEFSIFFKIFRMKLDTRMNSKKQQFENLSPKCHRGNIWQYDICTIRYILK